MSEYNISVFLGPYDTNDPQHQLLPAPQINLSYEPIYANDNIIGMSQKIVFNGTISSFVADVAQSLTTDVVSGQATIQNSPSITEMVATESDDGIITENDSIIITTFGEDETISYSVTNITDQNISNMRPVSSGVDKLTNIFNMSYGNYLTIRDSQGTVIVRGIGGKLRSLSFDQGSNAWVKTLPYSAEISFNNIEFFGEQLSCGTFWDSSNINGLVNLNNYPIKSFNDSWSIIVDGESFNYVQKSDTAATLKISNNTIQITYNISAVGEDYYRVGMDPPAFKPAWEIAKHFVQEKLYTQVSNLLSNVLSLSGGSSADDACDATTTLSTINDTTSPAADGLLYELNAYYNVFNEIIDCNYSVSDGSFAVTYSSIIKQKSNNSSAYDSDYTRHTVSKNINHSSNNGNMTRSMSINGTIEGLILGGLINGNKSTFELPNNGSFLVKGDKTATSKYENAQNLWNTLSNEDDITDNFKNALGVTNTALSLTGSQAPYPKSFNLTRNHIDGIIEYSLEYDNKCVVRDNTNDFTIQEIVTNFKDRTPVFAEFILPSIGIILQDIGTFTAKEISFTITGKNNNYKLDTQYSSMPPSEIIAATNIDVESEIIALMSNWPDYSNFIKTQHSQEINVVDGTYTLNLGYICSTGCIIL